ncbi:Endo-1,4-beta-xylanase/feruloyl esterase precursor [compost metagenome]
MNFVNPPAESPQYVTHKIFYSQVLNHEIGYNIYLPPGYKDCGEKYPVAYHIHGWTGNESSEIWPLEKVCKNRRAITVFVNAISSEDNYFDALMQIESILIKELIPHIDGQYRTDTTRENRMLSGFSMGGNMAFYYAVKHPELFGSVTPYAGTYHHLYLKEYRTVGVAPEKVIELYEDMMREEWYLEENNILCLVRQNAEKIRSKLKIDIHIGTADILFCDNEILHLYLDSLNIPHEYRKFEKIGHNLEKIV